MQLTGHPFIDLGLAIAANLSRRKTIEEVIEDDLKNGVKELLGKVINEQETNPRRRIQSEFGKLRILKFFWQNNPLMGINPDQLEKYEKILIALTKDDKTKNNDYCQICGSKGTFGIVNRSWFPLGGTPSNDPTTLPGLKGKKICTNCFRAVVLLPLGCLYCKTGPYFYHVTDSKLQVEAVAQARDTINKVLLTNTGNRVIGNQSLRKPTTQLKGRIELLEIVSGHIIWDHTQSGKVFSLSVLPKNGATIISFSNDKSARLIQLHLPAQALDFFSYLKEEGKNVYDVFINWARNCEGNLFEKICDDIEQRRSLAPLVKKILEKRKKNTTITKEEKTVLQDYENIALQKKERFDMLERLSIRINKMEEKYRNSFLKQLGNTTTLKKFLELLKQFSKQEKTGLLISHGELRALATDSNSSEAIILLFLLCISEQSEEN